MRVNKRKKLKAKGFKIGSAKDFLKLSEIEAEYIELKIALADSLRQLRKKRHMGQVKLAELIESSQSRVAKMEAADSSVTIDRIIRAHLALGASASDLGRTFSKAQI